MYFQTGIRLLKRLKCDYTIWVSICNNKNSLSLQKYKQLVFEKENMKHHVSHTGHCKFTWYLG